MDIHNLKNIYFVGIGGIGMSALARYFHAANIQVSGYDKTPSSLTKELENEGIFIHYEADDKLIPEHCDLVIYTPAVPSEFEEWKSINNRNIPCIKRAEALALICKGKKSIAVAGTHGKTTVTAMIAHVLNKCDFAINAFVGGLMSEYNSNVIINPVSEWVLVEADEYDRSFLCLDPDIAVVNAIDADHLDIYGSKQDLELAFEEFMKKCKDLSSLILNKGITPEIITLPISAITFSASQNAVYQAENIRVENGVFVFDILKHQNLFINGAIMPLPGRHNIENALAAIAVADKLGVPAEKIALTLSTFKGVKRRFELICRCENKVFYDDYAHHPEEIRALITALRELHPQKKICGVFQPHLFSRTRDFVDGFAKNLSLLDRVVITDIYPAREMPVEGIDAHYLLNKIKGCTKEYLAYNDIADLVCDMPEEIIVTIGAGDIDRLVPIISKKLKKCS